MLINLFLSFVLGVIEGVTEWLPVSSTGHMLLFDEFFALGVSPEFLEMFLVVIQLGAVLAVVVLRFRPLAAPVLPGVPAAERRRSLRLWGKILISCVPAAVIGLLFDDRINALFFNAPTICAALFVYGAVFIFLELGRKNIAAQCDSVFEVPVKTAVFIGLFQLLALIPGTSRSGATIIGAMLFGCSRSAATEYTFYLAVPVMAGAGLLKLLKFGFAFTHGELAVLAAGCVTAFLVSVFAIRFLTGFVKRHSFTGFGAYRIALALAVAAVWFLRK
ncbi:MAG: undecaprenyl-diphosphate phosphatase [Oscillospiraceae bacterium]|jgi:undecaprenyl-diphosphatase|nr:undecaprenyl-diphosphate phosphatase [Oscillospiraceae bacterium]